MRKFLYRGVNAEMHESGRGLMPKAGNQEFIRSVYYGASGEPLRDTYYGDGSVYGESEANAVVMHQRDSTQNPTSGVSTTPSFESAKKYALYDCSSGFVYQIDTERFSEFEVSSFEVNTITTKPAKPEDEEVILVAGDCGGLPLGIVVNVIAVAA